MLSEITLGQYFPGNSFIHRLDPRTKILSTLIYIIAIFLADEQVGYVANSPYTLIDGVKSASEIKFIEDNQKAEVLFNFLERFVILRVIK